jgi:hypothetical protein
MLVSSFNLSQLFNYAPYLFCKKNGSIQRSIVSVYGPGLTPGISSLLCGISCECTLAYIVDWTPSSH